LTNGEQRFDDSAISIFRAEEREAGTLNKAMWRHTAGDCSHDTAVTKADLTFQNGSIFELNTGNTDVVHNKIRITHLYILATRILTKTLKMRAYKIRILSCFV
jgi:hypothetical protein